MNVLVACEYSGTVRDAFRARGHEAWSCDLLPTESEEKRFHLEGDVREWLTNWKDWKWDLLIAHPPCTYLAVSGARWKYEKPGWAKEQAKALKFVQYLMDLPIPRICIENPVSIISSKIRKPEQIIQPWMFGTPESKATCLWLKGLPCLKATNILKMPRRGYWDNQTPSRQNKLGPSPTRGKERARFYPAIAEAMAAQWG